MFVVDVPAVSDEAQVSGGDARPAETRTEGDRREHARIQPDVQPETQTQHIAGINTAQAQHWRIYIEHVRVFPLPTSKFLKWMKFVRNLWFKYGWRASVGSARSAQINTSQFGL